MEGWTLVYSSNKMHQVNYIIGLLQENNITAVMVNKQDSFYLIGEIEVYVPVDQAFISKQLINIIQGE